MLSTSLYKQHKKEIIYRFLGAEDGIHSLENAIMSRPDASKAEQIKDGYEIHRRYAYSSVYDRFMNPRDKIVIIYLIPVIKGPMDIKDQIIFYEIY